MIQAESQFEPQPQSLEQQFTSLPQFLRLNTTARSSQFQPESQLSERLHLSFIHNMHKFKILNKRQHLLREPRPERTIKVEEPVKVPEISESINGNQWNASWGNLLKEKFKKFPYQWGKIIADTPQFQSIQIQQESLQQKYKQIQYLIGVSKRKWLPSQDDQLFQAIEKYEFEWTKIMNFFGKCHKIDCYTRYQELLKSQQPVFWNEQQDNQLCQLFAQNPYDWIQISKELRMQNIPQVKRRYMQIHNIDEFQSQERQWKPKQKEELHRRTNQSLNNWKQIAKGFNNCTSYDCFLAAKQKYGLYKPMIKTSTAHIYWRQAEQKFMFEKYREYKGDWHEVIKHLPHRSLRAMEKRVQSYRVNNPELFKKYQTIRSLKSGVAPGRDHRRMSKEEIKNLEMKNLLKQEVFNEQSPQCKVEQGENRVKVQYMEVEEKQQNRSRESQIQVVDEKQFNLAQQIFQVEMNEYTLIAEIKKILR